MSYVVSRPLDLPVLAVDMMVDLPRPVGMYDVVVAVAVAEVVCCPSFSGSDNTSEH